MLYTPYVNEQGGLDKVVLTAQNADESKELQDFIEARSNREAQGSGSERGWDKGFACEGDPYGIGKEYVSQSANPDAEQFVYIVPMENGTFDLFKSGTLIGSFPTSEDAHKAEAIAKGE